jgi:regulator of RNase E activity RraA
MVRDSCFRRVGHDLRGLMDESLLGRCRRIATATWSDALDHLKIAGVVDGVYWRCGAQRIAGPAVTVRAEVGTLGRFPVDAFDVSSFLRAARGGAVLVIATDGASHVSTFGGLAARYASSRKVAGVVIDGGCRDLEEIRTSGLFVASRNVTPRSGRRRVRVAEVGGNLSCGGVSVDAGDCVIGDETGVVMVPAARLLEALTVAEELAKRDLALESALDAGADFDVAARLEHLQVDRDGAR